MMTQANSQSLRTETPETITRADALINWIEAHRREINDLEHGHISLLLQVKNYGIQVLEYGVVETVTRNALLTTN